LRFILNAVAGLYFTAVLATAVLYHQKIIYKKTCELTAKGNVSAFLKREIGGMYLKRKGGGKDGLPISV
jgi:hypothetical protein